MQTRVGLAAPVSVDTIPPLAVCTGVWVPVWVISNVDVHHVPPSKVVPSAQTRPPSAGHWLGRAPEHVRDVGFDKPSQRSWLIPMRAGRNIMCVDTMIWSVTRPCCSSFHCVLYLLFMGKTMPPSFCRGIVWIFGVLITLTPCSQKKQIWWCTWKTGATIHNFWAFVWFNFRV